MNTKQKLEESLKDAIRSKDTVRKRTIRMSLSDIKLAEIEKKRELSESEVLSILQKEVKERQDVIEESQRANRPELVKNAEEEKAIIEEFLPEQLSEEELKELAQSAIDEVGATSMRDMGSVMKVLIPRLEGRTTGQQASQAVRDLLQ